MIAFRSKGGGAAGGVSMGGGCVSTLSGGFAAFFGLPRFFFAVKDTSPELLAKDTCAGDAGGAGGSWGVSCGVSCGGSCGVSCGGSCGASSSTTSSIFLLPNFYSITANKSEKICVTHRWQNTSVG